MAEADAPGSGTSQNEIENMPEASELMGSALVQMYAPPLQKVKNDLKELISKQNKVYIDMSAEKFKFENNDLLHVEEMIKRAAEYKKKLAKIKQTMQNIHQKSKDLKKRAIHVQACKERENANRLLKQQQEAALIGGEADANAKSN